MGIMGPGNGQSMASQYGAQLGGLTPGNSTMDSIIQRLSSGDLNNGLRRKATEDLAQANQFMESDLAGKLGSAGLNPMGGAGLAALTSLRNQNFKTFADTQRQLTAADAQNLMAAGNLEQGVLGMLMSTGGGIYGNALGGMGGLNGSMQQAGQANAAGRGQFWGGVTNAIGTIGGAALGALL